MKLVNLSSVSVPDPHRVFVLEDDMDLSAVIERVLRSIDSGVELDWATSVEGAIAQLERVIKSGTRNPYDLIVADIFLDGKFTGIDFWRTCQELFPHTPVLITSSLSLDRFFATIGESSISPPYLQKPFSAAECRQVFETMLRYSDQPHDKWSRSRRSDWII